VVTDGDGRGVGDVGGNSIEVRSSMTTDASLGA
jgi:hypothetical protein